MATDTTDTVETDKPFKIRSLIGESGTASNGEKIVKALQTMYPPELAAAQEKRPNEALMQDLDFNDVAKVVGNGVDIRDVVVRGGDLRAQDAWVSYAGYDADGDTIKGAFPYDDLGKKSSKEHVSQVDSLEKSDAARDFRQAEAKAAAAADTAGPAGSGDPIAEYEEMKATDVVAYVKAHPERAAVVEALEGATRPGDERTTVLDAVKAAKDENAGDDGTGGDSDSGAAGSGDAPPPPA